MWNWLRAKLGLEADHDFSEVGFDDLRGELAALRRSVNIQNRMLVHIMNKVDPDKFASEFDPERKARSDELAERALQRLREEARRSNPDDDGTWR